YKNNKEYLKEYQKEYRQNNKEKLKTSGKKYYEQNSRKIGIYAKEYRRDNKERLEVRAKEYRQNNKEKISVQKKEYRQANKENIKEYRRNNKEMLQAIFKEYRQNNKEKRNKYERDRRTNGPGIRINHTISTSIYHSLKGNKEGRRWESLVGYTLKQLRTHLQGQFQPGMAWGNYGKGGWEVDHVIPKSVFNYTKPEDEDFKRCWSLSNLQPMWKLENNSKGSKLKNHFQPMLAFS
ncbi:hypothetical protein LCGC14_1639150, partial [marine sediment metagenome]